MVSKQSLKDFGMAIRTERNAQGITIEQLAEMTDRSVRQIQNIEKGVSNTKLTTIIAIVRALECVLVIREDGTFTLGKAETEQKQPV